jgi:hypothetical protein
MNSLATLKTLTPDKVITVKAGTRVTIEGESFQLLADVEVYVEERERINQCE